MRARDVRRAGGCVAGGVLAIGAIIVRGPADSVGAVLAVTCAALVWAIVLCTLSGVRGRVAAK